MRFSSVISTSFLYLSVLAAPMAQANYDTLFIDAASGEAIEHYRLGYGETSRGEVGDVVTSMLYVGYYRSDDIAKIEDTNIGETEVEVLSIGSGGFGYIEGHHQNGGAEFDFELSQTRVEALDYDRTAIGFRTQVFLPVVAGLQLNLGFNLRPFFLASDWDDQAELEYEYQGGLEYAFNLDAAIYTHYRTMKVIDEDENDVTLAEDVVLGLRFRF
ncbi:hypothetical protein HF888_11035 [Bermanella marisrubri]|uniref:Outer membrane protein beta-barrel domain-containing protein n=1 Tax=Bermanella marisrubri TaxID=207949 RepID=Q1N5H3_9GAMM|nr:hypothetical protein [Bermanella marisrubri]EAT13969.1 hypothetical protein RED65_11264 [Oceanobacter sp. RED65] [Bermanella marisrubri]QIZ84718.1 hypothetical protein HF888_11035 [Bermanella marisrubri]